MSQQATANYKPAEQMQAFSIAYQRAHLAYIKSKMAEGLTSWEAEMEWIRDMEK